MKRRDFLAGCGLGGCSLAVLADQLPPAPTLSAAEIRRRLDGVDRAPRSTGAAEPHMTRIDLETDFLVAGGGLAGICAALAAARHGARVVLVQDRSRLGGNSSSEVKMHVCGAHAVPGWRESGIVEELRLEDAVHNPQRSFELWDLLLYDKVVSEQNITLLLDTTVYAAAKRGSRLTEVMARCDRTERLYRIAAKLFCDATGDCRLGLEAGAEMRVGREARAEFNEPLAPETPDAETLGSSILFTSRLYRRPMPFRPPKWARKIGPEHLRFRRIDEWDYGYWWIAWGGNKDTIRDNERIRFENLSIVMGVWDYIKNSGEFPQTANYAMDWVGFLPGKRESRRMVGDHILTQGDILKRDMEDAVAVGGWPLDDHPPAGFERADLRPNVAIRVEPYNIPYRALYSRNIANLFMAGRNVSATHVAFTSTRVMATCAVEGQAVGTAAAMCSAGGLMPRDLYERKPLLRDLQQALLRDDQTVRYRVNDGARDAARRAKVSAAAEEAGARAANITDGHLRDYPESGGKEVHQWAARLGPEGAWIELAWERPERIREVQITFDTGFQRTLMLSGSEAVTRRTVRAAQPETVRDYKIYRRSPGGALTEVASMTGNYQRVNRHALAAEETAALRVHVTATNGDDFARIFEVRCYG